MEKAMVAKTEMYGGKSSYDLIGIGEEEEAQAWAESYNPDYDDTVSCVRLAHNQAAGTCGIALDIIYAGPTCPAEDWTIIPEDLEQALCARYPDGETDEDLGDVIEAAGYLILCPEDAAAAAELEPYYLVRL
jgi:hypothetical protein